MALFKLTTKRRILVGGKYLDTGMPIEMHVSGLSSTLSLSLPRVKEQVVELFENKYGIELKPANVTSSNFEVECLSKR